MEMVGVRIQKHAQKMLYHHLNINEHRTEDVWAIDFSSIHNPSGSGLSTHQK